jgi:probable rRNA maturation factor
MILNRQREVRVSPASLRRFLRKVEGTLRLPRDCAAVCLIDDTQMARLNHTYRGKRGPTDVLSFPASSGNGARRTGAHKDGAACLGDIAISPAMARRNARAYGRSLAQELRILILHGVLHLMGYDHETDHGAMERKERKLRRQLGLEP